MKLWKSDQDVEETQNDFCLEIWIFPPYFDIGDVEWRHFLGWKSKQIESIEDGT